MNVWYPLQIRFRDLDPLAHVNNSVYFIYFEEARSYYFRAIDALWPAEEEHQSIEVEDEESPNPRIQTGPRGHRFGLLVKETTCTYELPLVRSDSAEVGIQVVKVGRSSFTMEHRIRDTQDLERTFATGRTVMVWANYYTGRAQPLPLSLRHAFEQMEGCAFPVPS